MTTTTLITADELLHMPENASNQELVAGELITMPPDNLDHGEITLGFGGILSHYIRKHNLGSASTNVGFVIRRDPDTVLGPDIAFVAKGREPVGPARRGFVTLCPDLAIEVLSPSNSASEINRKLRLYLDAGARQVWTIDPEARTVTIHTPDRIARTLVEGEMLEGGDVVPGFSIPVSEVFA